MGLLILRSSAGGSLFVYAFTQAQTGSPGWPLFGVGAVVVLILIGALTPVACIIGGLIEAYYISHDAVTSGSHSLFALMMLLSLALLGPGAYSIDAKLFGRRLIIPDED